MKTRKKLGIILILIFTLTILMTKTVWGKTITIKAETLKLRSSASLDSSTLMLLEKGEKFETLSEEGNFYKIKKGSVTGYVSKDFVTVEESSSSTNTSNNTTTNENTITNTADTSNYSNNVTNTQSSETSNTVDNQVPENTTPDNVVDSTTLGLNTSVKLNENTKIYILPFFSAEVLSDVIKDKEVVILSVTKNWSYIQSETISGWILNSKLGDAVVDTSNTPSDTNTNTPGIDTNNTDTKQDNQTQDTGAYPKTMYTTDASIRIRKEANTTSEIVTTVAKAESVKVVGEEADFYKVEVGSNKGYIAKRLLSDTKPTTSRSGRATETQTTATTNTTTKKVATTETKATTDTKQATNTTPVATNSNGASIVEFAKKQLGKPYVYGSSGPNSFDCSGFTTYVFKQFGYSLNRTSSSQASNGSAVNKSDLQVGDLVLFADSSRPIGHVGIYIGGNQFIHASSSKKKIVINSLSDSYYAKKYVTARRVLK